MCGAGAPARGFWLDSHCYGILCFCDRQLTILVEFKSRPKAAGEGARPTLRLGNFYLRPAIYYA
jgi:hypothetical protein